LSVVLKSCLADQICVPVCSLLLRFWSLVVNALLTGSVT